MQVRAFCIFWFDIIALSNYTNLDNSTVAAVAVTQFQIMTSHTPENACMQNIPVSKRLGEDMYNLP